MTEIVPINISNSKVSLLMSSRYLIRVRSQHIHIYIVELVVIQLNTRMELITYGEESYSNFCWLTTYPTIIPIAFRRWFSINLCRILLFRYSYNQRCFLTSFWYWYANQAICAIRLYSFLCITFFEKWLFVRFSSQKEEC